ncbi:MAG: toll/interleukin-1 receptor domain-containing protein, partial [Clostridia bacterium]|nr:toll/interleukin-1 receptor domain-containing protein [Clostridia bacterium]
MVCRAIPYEGTEPFIFVSYCHEDKKRIHPLLEQMVRDSYRIWYDENMHAGEDSADNIENHLEDCAVVIAFISENYSLSHSCRSELTYALKCRKKVISVLIEDFALSKGFRTQLNHFGCLKQSDFPNENAMLSGIYADSVCKDCNAPAGSLSLRNIVVYVTPKPIKDGKKQLRKKEAQIKPDDQSSSDTDNSSSDTEQKRSDHLQPVDQAELQTVIQNDKIGKTVFLSDFDDEEDEPICVVSKNIAILIQLSTKRAYILRTSQTKIGRSPIKCDVVIENND